LLYARCASPLLGIEQLVEATNDEIIACEEIMDSVAGFLVAKSVLSHTPQDALEALVNSRRREGLDHLEVAQ
jgi:hypothetical protein